MRTARANVLLLLLCLTSGCAGESLIRTAFVRVPIVDLRSRPQSAAQPGTHDPLEETQLLYGEHVRVLKTQGGWAYIESVEQPEFSHHKRWEGYPGWLPVAALETPHQPPVPTVVVTARWAQLRQESSPGSAAILAVPMGTRLAAEPEASGHRRIRLLDGTRAWAAAGDVRSLSAIARMSVNEKRRAVLESAGRLIGDPYYWGGRSAHHTAFPASGVDCSGLVGLAYRTVNLLLPRDAHEMAMRARPVGRPQPADAVFLSERGNPGRIVHVLLVAGADELIEAPGTGFAVRRITGTRRFGRPLASLQPGAVIGDQTATFGSFLEAESALR